MMIQNIKSNKGFFFLIKKKVLRGIPITLQMSYLLCPIYMLKLSSWRNNIKGTSKMPKEFRQKKEKGACS